MTEAQFLAACELHHRAFARPGRTLAEVMEKKRPVWMPGAGSGSDDGSSSGTGVGGGSMSLTPPRRHVVLAGRSLAEDAPAAGEMKGGQRGGLTAGQLLANAATLTRRVRTAGGERVVLGLLDVATDPATRGRGWRLGEAVVRRAWAELGQGGEGGASVCLFQTGEARGFYERLGARAVSNFFFNGTDAEAGAETRSAFDEPHAMIYPATAEWPEGPVDLRGPGW